MRGEIPLLIAHFADKIALEQGNTVKNFLLMRSIYYKNMIGQKVYQRASVVERLIILGGSQISENDVKLLNNIKVN
jgi:hypothetical protein